MAGGLKSANDLRGDGSVNRSAITSAMTTQISKVQFVIGNSLVRLFTPNNLQNLTIYVELRHLSQILELIYQLSTTLTVLEMKASF